MKVKQPNLIPLVTILIGGFIYILFRTTTLKMFRWFNAIGLSNEITSIRNQALKYANEIPSWVIFSLPDGLWVFSFITLMLSIWKNSINRQSLCWICSLPLIAILSEYAQLLKIVPGTFDSIDVTIYLLGTMLPLLIFKININLK